MDNVHVLNDKYYNNKLLNIKQNRNDINRESIALKMMFKKYMSKISNTIGTVNYLQSKAKENRPQKRNLYDDGYDVEDIDPATINRMDIDLSINGQRRASTVLGGLPANAQIVLSAAMANLRNTLLYYPLVSILWHLSQPKSTQPIDDNNWLTKILCYLPIHSFVPD